MKKIGIMALAVLAAAALGGCKVTVDIGREQSSGSALESRVESVPDDSSHHEHTPAPQHEQGHSHAPANSSGQDAAGITADEAKELALDRVPGAAQENIWEFKPDTDDGRAVYEGKIVYGGMEYEFGIDAGTGEFLEWEQEPADE